MSEIKWHPERGTIWRKLENKRLKMIKNGRVTTLIRNRRPTKDDERCYEFEHYLPRNNVEPANPEEYVRS